MRPFPPKLSYTDYPDSWDNIPVTWVMPVSVFYARQAYYDVVCYTGYDIAAKRCIIKIMDDLTLNREAA